MNTNRVVDTVEKKNFLYIGQFQGHQVNDFFVI